MAKSTSRLSELDALRGFAALFVVLFHYTMGYAGPVADFLQLGVTGVDLFFMISGFVIFMTIKKVNTANDFILGRFFRLYPAYWFCVTLYAGFKLLFGAVQPSQRLAFQYVANMTMLQNYFLQTHIDGVYWTLTVELLFYALILFLFIRKWLGKIELIGTVLTLILLSYGLFLSKYIGVWNVRILRFASLLDFFPLFFSGILYYKLIFERRTLSRLALLSLCFVTQLTLFHLVGDRAKWLSETTYASILLTYNGLFLLYTYNKLHFIVNPVTIFLGIISYPIYLTHNLVNFTTGDLFELFSIHLKNWVVIPSKIIVVITISYLIHHYIEVPTLAIYKRKKNLKPVSV